MYSHSFTPFPLSTWFVLSTRKFLGGLSLCSFGIPLFWITPQARKASIIKHSEMIRSFQHHNEGCFIGVIITSFVSAKSCLGSSPESSSKKPPGVSRKCSALGLSRTQLSHGKKKGTFHGAGAFYTGHCIISQKRAKASINSRMLKRNKMARPAYKTTLHDESRHIRTTQVL